MKEKTMAERHQDEINTIIADCHASIAQQKPIAIYSPRKGGVMPKGWTLSKARAARKAVKEVFAKCTVDMRAAVRRHRAEANAR